MSLASKINKIKSVNFRINKMSRLVLKNLFLLKNCLKKILLISKTSKNVFGL